MARLLAVMHSYALLWVTTWLHGYSWWAKVYGWRVDNNHRSSVRLRRLRAEYVPKAPVCNGMHQHLHAHRQSRIPADILLLAIGTRKILHTLVEMGSAAHAAAIGAPYPSEGTQSSSNGINEMLKVLWSRNLCRLDILGGSDGVVNSLDFCLASLKSLGCLYFRCVLSSQWKVVTVNLRILHCQL